MSSFGSFLIMNWHSTPEGRTHFQHLFDQNSKKRRQFGVLERPNLPMGFEEAAYKVFVTGKAGVGKTASVARLAGSDPPKNYHDTLGIQVTNIFWPAKVCQNVVLFKLQLWDAGDLTVKKYTHVVSACKEKVDGVLLTFSFMDKSTFDDLPSEINKVAHWDEKPAIFAMGTRFGVAPGAEVTQGNVDDFEQKCVVPVLKINNKAVTGKADLEEAAPLLNIICEKLWLREQERIARLR